MNLCASWIINSFAIVGPSRVLKKNVHYYGFIILLCECILNIEQKKYMYIGNIFVHPTLLLSLPEMGDS